MTWIVFVLFMLVGCKESYDNKLHENVTVKDGESSIKLDCGKKGVTIPYADEKTGLVGPLLEAGCKIVE